MHSDNLNPYDNDRIIYNEKQMEKTQCLSIGVG